MATGTQAGNLGMQLGSSALGSIVGEGIGLLFNGANNANQLSQQQALDQLQLGFNEQDQSYVANLNEQEQLKLWNATNYPAQVQQLEQAGLNPALLYGKGGGGGATTGGTQGGMGVGSAAAPSVSTAQTAQLAIQSQEAMADINLKNAQANNLNAKTPQEADVMNAQALNLTEGAKTNQAQQALQQMQTLALGVQTQIQGQTIDDQVAKIRSTAQQIEAEAQQAVRNNYVDQQTMQQKIDLVNANLVGQYISNNLQKSNIQVNQAQIQQIAQSIVNSRNQIAINQKNANTQDAQQQTNDGILQLQKLMQSYNMDQNATNQFMQGVSNLIPSLINATKPAVQNTIIR